MIEMIHMDFRNRLDESFKAFLQGGVKNQKLNLGHSATQLGQILISMILFDLDFNADPFRCLRGKNVNRCTIP